MTKIKDKIKVLVIFVFILSLSIFLTVNASPVCYWLAINYFHLNQISGLSSTSLMKCYFFMIKYLQVPWDLHLNLVFFKCSSRGLIHFRNVRHLIMFNNLCLLLFGSISWKIFKRWENVGYLWRLINPLKVCLTGGLILISMAMTNFQAFFIKFHQVMFRNHDWVFNTRLDPIIKVLPTSFFAWCFITFVSIITIIMILLIYKSK